MQAVQSIIVEFIKELEKHVRGWETVNIIQWHLVKSVPGLAVWIPWLVPPIQECNAKSQCNAEHNVCNAIQWRIMKDDDGALLYNTHIEVGVAPLCPCTLTDPDSWQLSTSTPTSCPGPLIPQVWKKIWHLPDFSHMPCKVCVQSGHFLSSFPSTAKTSENMSAWPIEMEHFSQCFSRFYEIVPWLNQILELCQNTTLGCAENVEKYNTGTYWDIGAFRGYPTLECTSNWQFLLIFLYKFTNSQNKYHKGRGVNLDLLFRMTRAFVESALICWSSRPVKCWHVTWRDVWAAAACHWN